MQFISDISMCWIIDSQWVDTEKWQNLWVNGWDRTVRNHYECWPHKMCQLMQEGLLSRRAFSFLTHIHLIYVSPYGFSVSFGHCDAIHFERSHSGADVSTIDLKKLNLDLNKYSVIVKLWASNILEHFMVQGLY